MKKTLTLILLSLLATGLSAQEVAGTFVQNRTLASTGETVRSEGIVHYTVPDQFRLNYLTPKGDYLILDGDMFRSKAGDRSMDVDVTSFDGLRGFRNTVMGCVNGNYAAVAREMGAGLDVQRAGRGRSVTMTADPAGSRGYSLVQADYNGEGRLVRLVLTEFSGNSTEFLFSY